MRKSGIALFALSGVLTRTAAFAQVPSRSPVPYVSPDTPQGTGPFKAIMEADPSLPTHTEYRPKDLDAMGGKKLPIIAWGNGACANAGNRFRYFLTEIASYGFLAIAIGPIGPKELEQGPRTNPATHKLGEVTPPPTPNLQKPPATHASQLIDAINWAIAENGRQGSRYLGKLDTSKIAIMGQSCGGVQAIQASSDPRVTTTVAWNSGLLPNPVPGMDNVSKDALKQLHAPIAYFTGDEAKDVAYPNAADDFKRLDQVPVLWAYRIGMPHIGTYSEPNGGELGKIAVAYLQWQLKGDENVAKMFKGEACTLCLDPNWRVFKKKID